MIDEIVTEPQGGAHLNPDEAARLLGQALGQTLDELSAVPGAELREQRRERYRRTRDLHRATDGNRSTKRFLRVFHRQRRSRYPQHPQCFQRFRSLEAGAKAGPECDPLVRDELFSTYASCF